VNTRPSTLSNQVDSWELLESSPDGVVIVDEAGQIVFVNAETERLFGYRRQELLGQPVEMLMPDSLRDTHRHQRTRYSADPHPRLSAAGLELVGLRKDGSEFPCEILLKQAQVDRARPLTVSTIRDVSDRKRLESDLAHFAAVVSSSEDAIIAAGLDGRVVSWNAAAERLYGYSADEMLCKPLSVLAPHGAEDDFACAAERALGGERVVNFETVQAKKDGTPVDVSLTVSPVRDKRDHMTGTSTIARDVSALVRYRDHLRYLADHDALTNTLNRRRFERDLQEQFGRARRYGERAVVMVVDVDHFKQINDRYGHRAGDEALKAIAGVLRRRLRQTDSIARLGGDEFALLLPYAGPRQAQKVARDLRAEVARLDLDLGARDRVRTSVSVGVAILDGEMGNHQDVLAAADRAMYEDKLGSRDTASTAAP